MVSSRPERRSRPHEPQVSSRHENRVWAACLAWRKTEPVSAHKRDNEDGYTHTALSKPVRPKDPEAALKAKLEAAAKAEAVRAAWERANLPPEIAALRQAQRDAAKTNTVTVTIEH